MLYKLNLFAIIKINNIISSDRNDIVINGIKADFGSHHQQSGQWSDKKGSSVIDDKFEYLQNDVDWFEDAQDLAFPEKVFSKGGDDPSNKFFSFDGYISDGIYTDFPFRDKNFTDDHYSLLSNHQKNSLLKNSNITISQIGTRYRSASTSYDVHASKTKVVKNFFGKDSISFRNMDRS